MVNSIIKYPVRWSHLPKTQKVQGVHPNVLRHMCFDTIENPLSVSSANLLQNFFTGSRLASDSKEFFGVVLGFQRQNKIPGSVVAVAKRVFKFKMPEELLIRDRASFPVQFVNEKDSKHYSAYVLAFSNTYNKLINSNKSFLMHPARRGELENEIKDSFIDSKLVAERLTTLRCYGYDQLNICELERKYRLYESKLVDLQLQLSKVVASEPKLVKDPRSLQERDFSCISSDIVRKHVFLVYRELVLSKDLEILKLPQERLYIYQGMVNPIHPLLVGYEKDYYGECATIHHFGVIVKYLRALKNGNFNDLLKLCLEEEIECIGRLLDFTRNVELLEAKEVSTFNEKIYGKTVDDFEPGNFNFLKNSTKISWLTNAYNAVEKLDAWSYFDKEPSGKMGYMLSSDIQLREIGKELELDGHSGASMGETMRWMQKIRQMGWQTVVSENLSDVSNQMGVLQKARLKTAKSQY
ncbi:MAG: hypothetical protein VX777_09015 [Chlamydiota bacterium]|nr:hypothetical protein [Chlamydiota bacterium]